MDKNILSSTLFRKVLLFPAFTFVGFAALVALYFFQHHQARTSQTAYSNLSKGIELVENAQGLVYELTSGESHFFITVDPLTEKKMATTTLKLTQSLTKLYQLEVIAQEHVQPIIDKILSYGQLLKENHRLISDVHPLKSQQWKKFDQSFREALPSAPIGDVQNMLLDYYLIPLQLIKGGFNHHITLPAGWPQGLEHLRSQAPNPAFLNFANAFQQIWGPLKEITSNVKDQVQIIESIHPALEDMEESLHKKMSVYAARLADLNNSSTTWFMLVFILGSIAVLGFSIRLAYHIATPIFRLTQQLTQLKDGESLEHVPHTHRSDEIGDMARALDIFRDKAQDIHKMQKQLQLSIQESRRQNQIRHDMMDQMSQELRTPLTAIINYSEGIISSVDSGTSLQQLRENIQQIATSGQHLLTMVDAMIQLTEQEDDPEVILEDFNVRERVQLSLPELEPIILKNNNKFNVHCSDPSLRMHSDARKISRLLTQLVTLSSNSFKNGRILLEITLSTLNQHEAITMKITDSGPTLSTETLQRLDEHRHYAVLESNIGVEPLYYQLMDVKRIIDLLDGSFRVQNGAMGRNFIVTLPRMHQSVLDDLPVRVSGY